MTTPKPKKISPLAKLTAAGMSVFMFGYGIFIIIGKHYYGYSSKHGGAEINVNGLPAMMIGMAIIAIGLTPLALWAKSGTVAGIWAGTCMIVGIILFLAPLYIK